MMYQLELQSGISYWIKVADSSSSLGAKKFYFKRKELNKVWVLFATCEREEEIENTIRVHFGSRGKLEIVNE